MRDRVVGSCGRGADRRAGLCGVCGDLSSVALAQQNAALAVISDPHDLGGIWGRAGGGRGRRSSRS